MNWVGVNTKFVTLVRTNDNSVFVPEPAEIVSCCCWRHLVFIVTLKEIIAKVATRQRKSAMTYNIYLAMLSVVPLCSGAPLNPRLQEFLTWFLDNQRTIDRSIESGSTVVEDTTADTTTEWNFMSSTVYTTLINIASTTLTEQITTQSKQKSQLPQFQLARAR